MPPHESVSGSERANVDIVPLDTASVRRVVYRGEWLYSVDDLLNYFREDVQFYKQWWRVFSQKRDERGYKDQIQEVVIDGANMRLVNSVGVFRLVQGLKGARADKVKNWLAQIAVERATEELNPSLAVERAIRSWYSIGHSDSWIIERLRGLRVRKGFTDEMQRHGAEKLDYGILTNIVHQGTFGISVKSHYELKSLRPGDGDLREEMSTTELILISLGEHTSTMLAHQNVEKTVETAKSACQKGGSIAGKTRVEIEKALGRSVVTSDRASLVAAETSTSLGPG